MWFKKKKDLKKKDYINKYISIIQVKHEKDEDNYYTLYFNTISGICDSISLNDKKAYFVIQNKIGFWKVYNKVYLNTNSILKIIK